MIEFIGADIRASGAGGPETRFPVEGSLARLKDWSTRYGAASLRDREADLVVIGQEMFGWLDEAGWASAWAIAPGDRELEIRVAGVEDAREATLLDAPWELLARQDGPLALDALRLFIVARRIGPVGAALEPERGDLRLMFMAAAPEGQSALDFEAEEVSILDATKDGRRVHLVVEETGALESLRERLTSDEGPFEVVHLSCHGEIVEGRGPVLLLETLEGDPHSAGPGEFVAALGPQPPPLVVLSACRTAELGAGARRTESSPEVTAPFARQVATMAANVVGWDGSVYDDDATDFAAAFYGVLGQRSPVARAAAVGRRELLRQRAEDPGHGVHWHLARVYLGPGGGGTLCATGKPTQTARSVERTFLDKARSRVPVASREAFVGRRRPIQTALRALREGATGVLVHGMGALGKSSLAARLATRTPLRPVVIFERYDALAILDRVLEAVEPPKARLEARKEWRAVVEEDHGCLAEALEALLADPLDARPILLIVDDLERVLATPMPGESKTAVAADYRVALGAVLRAFAHATTRSRLLLTSRYDFRLPEGSGDLARDLVRLHLQPMPERDRAKQLRAAERLAGREDAGQDEQTRVLLDRALALAAGNPGLQAALTTPILKGELTAASEALEQIEHYRRTGAPPEEIQALIDTGRAHDSDNELVAFFARLSFQTYRNALTADEARQLSAATLFSEGVPIPQTALAAAGQALGVEAPDSAVARLLGLGLFDDWGLIGGHAHSAANALARPLAPALDPDDRARLARAAFPRLQVAWRDAGGRFPQDHRGLIAAQIALEGCAEAAAVEAAVLAGAGWLYWSETRPREAFDLIARALVALPPDHAADPDFLSLGVDVANLRGDAGALEALLARPARPPATETPIDAIAHANLDLRRATRLIETGRSDAAEALVRSARGTFNAAGEARLTAIAAGQIADILEARGELDETLRIRREEQLPVYDLLGELRERTLTMGKIAGILQARGEFDEALRIRREEELPVFDRLGDVHSRAVTMGRIADIMEVRGDFDEALRIRREEELPVYDRLGDVRSRAVTMGRIADIMEVRGNLDEALRIRRDEQLPLYDHLGDVRARA
ncbi:MAG TPA: CHAT domain-containing protein, partial [Egibacteraceae bacterium]|nr:CHAT domain-containing protein [Egibacteraceae bacterium]